MTWQLTGSPCRISFELMTGYFLMSNWPGNVKSSMNAFCCIHRYALSGANALPELNYQNQET